MSAETSGVTIEPSENISSRSRKRCGVLVVGGAVVEIDPDGRRFAKAATVEYLSQLAAQFGTAHLFAAAIHKESPVYCSRIEDPVVFHSLAHVTKTGVKRIGPLLKDMHHICMVARKVDAALEFFPSGGGLIGSSVLRALAPRYGVYFGTDPRVALRTIPHLTGVIRQLLKRLASRFAAAIADFVLVRDPLQFGRLQSGLLNRVHLSAPISALRPPAAIRQDRCQGCQITLLYVGMFSERKGILDLLATVRLLAHDPKHLYRLLLVGAPEMLGPDGYSLARLEEQSRSFGVSERVEFRGYLDDMCALRSVYEDADIFVLASRREGFPRVVEEALVCGVPVVAFELASLRQVLKDRVHAMLVKPGDVSEFAEAIKEVALDDVLRQSLVASGREFMESRPTLPAYRQHGALLKGELPVPTP